MRQDEIKALFDRQAASYDTQWEKTAPILNCLHLLLESMFAELPGDARILCVGVGTGAELARLAQANPRWRFTAVEPSGAMLDICRKAYAKDVGVLPPNKVASIIEAGGFELPVQFFQAGLINAWLSKRALCFS